MGNHYQASVGIIPLWIMLGTEGPDPELPCRLWASAVLTKAELITRTGHVDLLTWQPPWAISHDAELRAFMPAHDILIIDGASWGLCIAELMRIWTPEGGRARAIGPGQGELDPAWLDERAHQAAEEAGDG